MLILSLFPGIGLLDMAFEERTGDALEDIKTHIFECSTDEMVISVVKMTDAELSKIPEFDGW